MTREMFPQQPWLAPLAGTLLIVLGGLQLIYATLWFVFALAAGFLGAVIDFGVTVVTTDPRGTSTELPSEARFASEVELGSYLTMLGYVHYLQVWIEMVIIYSMCGACLTLLAVVVWLSPRLREAQDAVAAPHRQASS